MCDTLEAYNIWFNQSSSKIDTNFRDNRFVISAMRRELSDLVEYSPDAIEQVLVHGYSSPEGREKYNYRLSIRRARQMQELLRSIPGMEDVNMEIQGNGEDWDSFIAKVEKHYHGQDRDLILRILNMNISYQIKKRWLKILDEDGATWRILMDHFMDDSRRATTEISVRRGRVMESLPELRDITAQAVVWPEKYVRKSTPPVEKTEMVEAEPVSERIPKAAIRTNLLVPALNVGLEIPMGNKWSVAADYYYPWLWPSKKNKDCFELLGLSLELRRWFGRDRQAADRLKGHSLGLYAAAGYYDFEKDYHGMQGEFVSSGLDYTYSTAVGRKKRVNLQFTLAVGYIRSLGRSYNVYADYGQLYPEAGTVVWDYIGPTKLAVTLSVPLYGKEGRR